MSDVKQLIAEARSDEPTDWWSLAWHLADALEESERERDDLAATLERVRVLCGSVEYRVSGKHDTWDQYHEGRSDFSDAVEQILDAAPSVARPLPDREAVRRVIAGRATILNDHQVDELTDAVLAAIGTAPPVPSVSDREALARIICSAVYGEPDNLSRATEAADAILAAGFRRSPAPEQVSTVEELDALPVGSVVRDMDGGVSEKNHNGRWLAVNSHFPFASVMLLLPATVLYRPEGGESA